MANETINCPACGAPVRGRWISVIWHVLNRWHNPITAFSQAFASGMSRWFLIGLFTAVFVGMFVVGWLLAALG